MSYEVVFTHDPPSLSPVCLRKAEKLLRPANISPLFTQPPLLYPFPRCVATYYGFKAFKILSSETACS